jgi:hypothetical protein
MERREIPLARLVDGREVPPNRLRIPTAPFAGRDSFALSQLRLTTH